MEATGLERCILFLLVLTSLAAASHRHPHLLVTRGEKQDSFRWYGQIDCPAFSEGTATGKDSFGVGYDCICSNNLTFTTDSTENNQNKCVSYVNESKQYS